MAGDSLRFCALYDLGLSVLPLRPRSKKPALASWAPYQTARAPELDVLQWGLDSELNLAIVTGRISAVFVLDVDDEAALAALTARHGALPKTWRVRTRRGCHVYFRHPGFHIVNKAKLFEKVDVRGDGGYVVAPPSIHESGWRYVWEVGPEDAPLADAPDWLLDMLRGTGKGKRAPGTTHARSRSFEKLDVGRSGRRYVQAVLGGELARVHESCVGERNNQLNVAALKLGQLVGAGLLDEDRVADELLDAATGTGLTASESRRTIRSGLGKGVTQPRELPIRSGHMQLYEHTQRYFTPYEVGTLKRWQDRVRHRVRKKGSLPESVMKVALALAHFASADHTGACHPKLETLSAKAGVCVKTAQRALAALEQIQLVHRFRAPTIRSRWPITYYTLCLHEHAWHEADERARDAENALRERERAICPGGGACSAARSELDRASGQTDRPAEIVRASPQPLSVSGADGFRTLDDAEKRTDLRSSGQCGWSPDVLQIAHHGGILLYEKDIKMENRTARDALKRARAREAVSRPTPTTTGPASTARTEVTSAARTLSGDHRSDPLRRPERRHGPRANGLALERSEEVEDQPAARAHDVERFGDRAESEAPTVEDLDRLDELLQRARPAVELPDDERVALGA